eukprot:scaffold114657_cov17-Tisochrysis_lutea.AAC.1
MVKIGRAVCSPEPWVLKELLRYCSFLDNIAYIARIPIGKEKLKVAIILPSWHGQNLQHQTCMIYPIQQPKQRDTGGIDTFERMVDTQITLVW